MPLPGNISTVTVTGKYLDIFGMPIVGKVQFTILPVLIDGGAKVVIVPRVVEAILNSSGAFSVDLPATDDPDLNPTNFTIKVTEVFEGGGGRPPFNISLPAGTPPIDITQFATTEPPGEGEVTFATTSALFAEAATRASDDAAILAQKGAANGIAPLGADSKVNSLYLPDLSGTYIPLAQKAAASGVASLDGSTKIPTAQIPDLAATYVATTTLGAASGVATLNGSSKLTTSQVPDLSATYQVTSEKAAASGYASLDSSTLVPSAQIPLVPEKVPFFTVFDRLAVKAASFDDPQYLTASHVLTSGTAYLVRVPIRNTVSVTAIDFFIQVAAATITSATAQIYNGTTHAAVSGTSVSISSVITTVGYATVSISSTSLAAGEYWIAFLVVATTPPGVGGIAASVATALPANMGRTTATQYRHATHSTTGLSSLPGTVVPVLTNAREIFAALR